MRPTLFAAWRKRLNLRLHPLLAVGIGLGLLALVLPSAPKDERQTDQEILACLLEPGADADLSLLFWLRQRQLGSALWSQALEHCSEPAHAGLPNCLSLESLERLAASLEARAAGPEPEPSTDPSTESGGTP